MWKMLPVILAALLGSAVTGRNINRIIGGEECQSDSHPYQVALHYFSSFICGGVLIDECWVLTAGHCNMTNIQIRLGAHSILSPGDFDQYTYAVAMFPHPDFNETTYENDIMLLKLASPAVIGPYVQTIPLADMLVEDGTSCLTSGWGTTTSPAETYPDVLQCVNITVTPHSDCRLYYPDDEITESMLCAGDLHGGKDTCQGDSGGPLVCNSVLHGITSWGHRPCGQPAKPGIYTKVVNYIEWIDNIMQSYPCP
ncbi:trypsin-like [Pelobates fuscus]|uniref:trypsin-like n=1 Tax=Pelobates fuscus TaxID=191477 RepID=UPI002FE443EE